MKEEIAGVLNTILDSTIFRIFFVVTWSMIGLRLIYKLFLPIKETKQARRRTKQP